MAEFNEFVFERPDGEPLLSTLFALFEGIADKIQESDEAAALPKEYNSEFLSIIRSYVRRVHVAFMSMSFEQVCDLATEFELYTNGATSIVHDSLTIEENIEKTMLELRAGIRDKDRLLDELEVQCNQLRAISLNATSRSLLQAEATLAEERRDEMKAVEKTYEFSDIPESRLNVRVGVERERAQDVDTSMETITDAALNIALCQARLGKLQDAMQLVNEHMRVSQQSSNSRALIFSLAALCQILARAVPGSLELDATRSYRPSKSLGGMHYAELIELLRRLDEGSQTENIPEMSLFARLLSTELVLTVGEPDNRKQSPMSSTMVKPSTSSKPSTTTLETCLHTKQLACELSTLAAGGPSKLSSSLFAPPKPAGISHSFAHSDSRMAMYAQQCTQTANQIRAAGWQVWGGSRISLEMALGVLHSAHKSQESEVAALSLVLANLYDQHGPAPFERLQTNGKLMELVKTDISLQRTWDMIHQRMAVHDGRWRDAVELASKIFIHPKPSEITHVQNIIESHELTALAYLAGGEYEDADRLAKEGYILAKKACITTYTLQLLLLRGRIHLEAGSWETASPFFHAVLDQYQRINADLIGAEATMYMSQVKLMMATRNPEVLRDWKDSVGTASRYPLPLAAYTSNVVRELEACLPTLLAHAPLETKTIARLSFANAIIIEQSSGGLSTPPHGHDPISMSPSTAHRILPLLRDAERDALRLQSKKLRASVLYLAAIAYDKLDDPTRRDACAAAHGASYPPAHRHQQLVEV